MEEIDTVDVTLTGTTINVSSENGDAFGIRDGGEDDSGKTISLTNSQVTAASSGEGESFGVQLNGSNQVNFAGTNTVKADVALQNNGATINVGSTDQTNAVLNVDGLIDSTGTTNLTGSALKVVGEQTGDFKLGIVNAVGDATSSVSVVGGTYNIAEFNGKNKELVFEDLSNTKAVVIDKKTGALEMVATGDSNDQYGSAQEAANALLEKTEIGTDENKDSNKLNVEAGAVNNSLAADVVTNEDGTTELTNVQEVKNDKLDAFGSVAALSALSLRHEMNSLAKRMGELRDAPAGTGLWVRAYGSEMEYGDQNVIMKSNSIQIGADRSFGDWRVGAAFTYTDGDTTYDLGTADTKGYGLALYSTWFVPCGAYVDLMAKYNRLDNDFGLNGMNGSYDSNAFGASVETGYRFEFLQGGLYLEPQVGLNYGRIGGETINTSNGVTIDQDSYNSLIGRAGIRAGFKFPENKGTIYARVSGLYDFDGEVNGTASKGVAHNTIEEDMGGAWIEMGIGANFNWTDNTYTYVDFERSNGGEVKENYRWNVGVRHTF